MPGNPLVRFDEGRVGRTFGVALSPTLPVNPLLKLCAKSAEDAEKILVKIQGTRDLFHRPRAWDAGLPLSTPALPL